MFFSSLNHEEIVMFGNGVSRFAVRTAAAAVAGLAAPTFAADGVSYRQMADALHAVMEADRTVYTRVVVNRLQNEEKVITASEHWQDDKALPLPAQMFRFGAEMVAERNAGFTYSLLSQWAVNKQNMPRTAVETEGLRAVAADPATPFYKEETLAGTTYFTAVYPDKAVSTACVSCHNAHKDSPRPDFKLNDVMGGVVLRIPMQQQ
jgi:hypothetical protein